MTNLTDAVARAIWTADGTGWDEGVDHSDSSVYLEARAAIAEFVKYLNEVECPCLSYDLHEKGCCASCLATHIEVSASEPTCGMIDQALTAAEARGYERGFGQSEAYRVGYERCREEAAGEFESETEALSPSFVIKTIRSLKP